jgi:hypothetical protein
VRIPGPEGSNLAGDRAGGNGFKESICKAWREACIVRTYLGSARGNSGLGWDADGGPVGAGARGAERGPAVGEADFPCFVSLCVGGGGRIQRRWAGRVEKTACCVWSGRSRPSDFTGQDWAS